MRRFVCVICIFALLVGFVPIMPCQPASASVAMSNAQRIQNGVTLHCWNWSYANIEANMAKIAEQIKGILVDSLRIPAEELDYEVELFGDGIGLDSIDSLEIIAGIDQEQYEAARIDGAGRIQQMIHITLPGLLPTISMLLVLNMGSILNVGYEKILLLYQPLTYEVADVISTYVYRKGMLDADYSFSTAVNLFNSAINIIFLVVSNRISKKMGQSGLF